jgi:hypothetical protein
MIRISRQSKLLDVLFVAHALLAGLIASCCLVTPHFLDVFLMFHGQQLSTLSIQDTSEMHGQIHTLFRLFGAYNLVQSFQVWRSRATDDAYLRMGICQAYCLSSTLVGSILLYGQLMTPHFHIANWLNIIAFGYVCMCVCVCV